MALIPFLVEIFQVPIFFNNFNFRFFWNWGVSGNCFGKIYSYTFSTSSKSSKGSVDISVLFLFNAILNVPRFASTEKIELSNVIQTGNTTEITSLFFLIFGMNTGFLTVLAISVTLMTFVLLKFTHNCESTRTSKYQYKGTKKEKKPFCNAMNLTPSTFEVLLCFLYQLGITIGILAGTVRKVNLKLD